MATKSKVTGVKEAQQELERMTPRGLKAFAGAMYAEGLHILRDSVPRTPVITSRLRNSQFATIPSKNDLSMRVGYGTKYAYRVHEGIVTRVKDLPRGAQRAFWAGATVTTSSRSGGSTATWKTSEVGGPNFLSAAGDATRSGRQNRIQRTFTRYFANNIGVLPGAVPATPKE